MAILRWKAPAHERTQGKIEHRTFKKLVRVQPSIRMEGWWGKSKKGKQELVHNVFSKYPQEFKFHPKNKRRHSRMFISGKHCGITHMIETQFWMHYGEQFGRYQTEDQKAMKRLWQQTICQNENNVKQKNGGRFGGKRVHGVLLKRQYLQGSVSNQIV